MANPLVVDVRATSAAATSVAVTVFSPLPVAGGVILFCYGTYLGVAASQHQAPTDNFGNTYTQVGTGIDQANVSLSLWRARNIVTGVGHQVTGHLGVAANVIGMAWALDAADEVNNDFTSATLAVASTPSVGPSSPAPAANSMFLAFLGTLDAADHGVPSGWNTQGSNGFTAAMQASGRAFIHAGVFNVNLFGAYLISSAVATATWTNAIATSSAVAVMVSVKPAAAPDPLASMNWFAHFPDSVPHRRTWPHWQHTGPVLPPDPPMVFAVFPDSVPHTPQYTPTGGVVESYPAVQIPIPDVLHTETFAATFPGQIPHRRLAVAAMPSIFAPPIGPIVRGLGWHPTFPDQVPHRRVSIAAMPSLWAPAPGPLIQVAQSMAWQATFPDSVPHRRTPQLGGPVFVNTPSAANGTIGPGICVTLNDLAVTQSDLIHVQVTQTAILDTGVTQTTLLQTEVC